MTPQEWGMLHNAQTQASANMNVKTDPNQFLGGDYGYLQGQIKQNIQGQNPIFSTLFNNASKRINQSTGRNIRSINEALSSSGFRGAGANLINDAYQNEQNALSQVSDSLASQELQFKNSAINQLLGLNQFAGSTALNTFSADRSFQLANQQMLLNDLRGQQQFEFQKDQASTGFGDVLGGILGSAIGAFTGGLGGGAASSLSKTLFG